MLWRHDVDCDVRVSDPPEMTRPLRYLQINELITENNGIRIKVQEWVEGLWIGCVERVCVMRGWVAMD